MKEKCETIQEGMIPLGSPAANELGFTADLFDGYLWRVGQAVYISFIISLLPGKGNLSRLFNAIEAHELQIAVPTPFPHMQAILERKGFVPHYDDDCEVWQKPCGEYAPEEKSDE